jgi:hypothetical protein
MVAEAGLANVDLIGQDFELNRTRCVHLDPRPQWPMSSRLSRSLSEAHHASVNGRAQSVACAACATLWRLLGSDLAGSPLEAPDGLGPRLTRTLRPARDNGQLPEAQASAALPVVRRPSGPRRPRSWGGATSRAARLSSPCARSVAMFPRPSASRQSSTSLGLGRWRTAGPLECTGRSDVKRTSRVAALDASIGRILLKNSEIEPSRKSRFRARCVISADSPHGRASRSVARGKAGRSAEPPREFFIKAASGLLSCDRCENSSFSTL